MSAPHVRRRDFIATGALAAGALAFGPAFWRQAFAGTPATAGVSPYGPLAAADANGLQLPAGFTSRVVARGGQVVPGTTYPWPIFPDGSATYATTDGGWILVANSESLPTLGAGSSAMRFSADGTITNAYRILGGTSVNCAGGRTPWGTWLSCEEVDGGLVWEADPLGRRAAVSRPAMGVFKHEAAAVDPLGERVYLTEDTPDGCFYRFTPTKYPALTDGVLEVLVGAVGGKVTWARIPDPSFVNGTPTRSQVANAAHFSGGEGIWYDSGFVYFSAKGDNAIYAYDTINESLEFLFNGKATPDSQLSGVDNVTVSKSGDLFVCEDNGEAEYSIGIVTRDRVAAPFLTVGGDIHANSELAGVVFDPSGKRMYFGSQRAFGGMGGVFEVTGPFRVDPPAGAQHTGGGEPDPLPADLPPLAGTGQEPLAVVEDVDGPGVKATVAKRISVSGLLRKGLTVTVDVKRPGTATVALRSNALVKEAGSRGSTDRPKLVTLASATATFSRAGRYKVVLKPKSASQKKRLRTAAKTFKSRVTVQAKTRSGKTAVSNRAVSVSVPSKRR
jgi:secreted PhoX family phosphatase